MLLYLLKLSTWKIQLEVVTKTFDLFAADTVQKTLCREDFNVTKAVFPFSETQARFAMMLFVTKPKESN